MVITVRLDNYVDVSIDNLIDIFPTWVGTFQLCLYLETFRVAYCICTNNPSFCYALFFEKPLPIPLCLEPQVLMELFTISLLSTHVKNWMKKWYSLLLSLWTSSVGDLQSVIARVCNGRVPGKNCLVSKHMKWYVEELFLYLPLL